MRSDDGTTGPIAGDSTARVKLGDGTNTNRRRPTAVLGGLRFRSITVGQDHSCGITTEDWAYCWGFNGFGQLGDGTLTNRLTPGVVAGGHHFRQIRAGIVHTCALTPLDLAFCWGAGGRLGDGTTTERRNPVQVLGTLTVASAGPGKPPHVRRNHRRPADRWGNNGNGESATAPASRASADRGHRRAELPADRRGERVHLRRDHGEAGEPPGFRRPRAARRRHDSSRSPATSSRGGHSSSSAT